MSTTEKERRGTSQTEIAAEVCYSPHEPDDPVHQLVRVVEELVLPPDCESYTKAEMQEAMQQALLNAARLEGGEVDDEKLYHAVNQAMKEGGWKADHADTESWFAAVRRHTDRIKALIRRQEEEE